MVFAGIIKSIVNYLLPNRCVSCREFIISTGEESAFTLEQGFCASCWGKLNFITSPFCNKCGRPFEFKMPQNLTCGSCITFPPKFDSARSLLRFDERSKKLIHDFKYHDKTHLAKIFAQVMSTDAYFAQYRQKIDIILPVPMHWLKRIFRRYNQAQILALALAHKTKKKYIPDLLIKHKNTKSQVGLSKAQRQKNLKNTISFNKKYHIKDQNILLVDDVRTTGATIGICAQILKQHGAGSVHVITIAHNV